MVCNGVADCLDGSDEENCGSWKCRFDEFECPSQFNETKTCVPISKRCNGQYDCLNGEDERSCHAKEEQCSNDEFHCREQGTCIPRSWHCDGEVDCSGDEDETLCGKF